MAVERWKRFQWGKKASKARCRPLDRASTEHQCASTEHKTNIIIATLAICRPLSWRSRSSHVPTLFENSGRNSCAFNHPHSHAARAARGRRSRCVHATSASH
eukprot:3055572-Prymnesium_polylepis.1